MEHEILSISLLWKLPKVLLSTLDDNNNSKKKVIVIVIVVLVVLLLAVVVVALLYRKKKKEGVGLVAFVRVLTYGSLLNLRLQSPTAAKSTSDFCYLKQNFFIIHSVVSIPRKNDFFSYKISYRVK